MIFLKRRKFLIKIYYHRLASLWPGKAGKHSTSIWNIQSRRSECPTLPTRKNVMYIITWTWTEREKSENLSRALTVSSMLLQTEDVSFEACMISRFSLSYFCIRFLFGRQVLTLMCIRCLTETVHEKAHDFSKIRQLGSTIWTRSVETSRVVLEDKRCWLWATCELKAVWNVWIAAVDHFLPDLLIDCWRSCQETFLSVCPANLVLIVRSLWVCSRWCCSSAGQHVDCCQFEEFVQKKDVRMCFRRGLFMIKSSYFDSSVTLYESIWECMNCCGSNSMLFDEQDNDLEGSWTTTATPLAKGNVEALFSDDVLLFMTLLFGLGAICPIADLYVCHDIPVAPSQGCFGDAKVRRPQHICDCYDGTYGKRNVSGSRRLELIKTWLQVQKELSELDTLRALTSQAKRTEACCDDEENRSWRGRRRGICT